MRNEKGFTLMELMIVIVIIGVLAAIGVPAYKGMTDKARKASCDANLRTVQTAVAMYYSEHGEYLRTSQRLPYLTWTAMRTSRTLRM